MARPYSVDLRERVVRAVEGGASRRAAAAKFEVSISFVVKLMQRWHQRGTLQPDRIGGWKEATLAAHGERLRALVATEPDLTIAELRRRLADEGIATSRSGVGRFLAAAGLTRKKRRCTPPSRTVRTCRGPASRGETSSRDEPAAADVHRRDLGQDQHDPTAAGRSGRRVIAAVPHGHWKTTTLIAALCSGILCSPGCRRRDQRRVFVAYVQQVLVPTLGVGDVVVMDNLKAHKVNGVREAIEAPAPASSICRRTRRTSTRSSWPSPSSRPCSAAPQPEASTCSGNHRPRSSTPSAPPNVPTTSPMPAMFHLIGNRSRAIGRRSGCPASAARTPPAPIVVG